MALPITNIHSYLVHPGKGIAKPQAINGTNVGLSEKIVPLLEGIYLRSDTECETEIAFRHDAEGKPQNECRDLLLNHIGKPSLVTGRSIAERLQLRTDGRSGLGLLFVITGKEGAAEKVVISRFPTDNAIWVDESGQVAHRRISRTRLYEEQVQV
jgi:hypothetical protein